MRIIGRYIYFQTLSPLVLSTGAILSVAVFAQLLSNLDILVIYHQSIGLFLSIVALSLPGMAATLEPLALFIAILAAMNRLHTEQEIVVCYAAGVSRRQVTSPVFRLAAVVTLATLALNLWVTPIAYRTMREEIYRVRADLAATLVRTGEFQQPAAGLTVYAQGAKIGGRLTNVFIYFDHENGGSGVYSAAEGVVTKSGDKPLIVLKRGSRQQFGKNNTLDYLYFDEYTLDLSDYISNDARIYYHETDRFLHELLFRGPTQLTGEQNHRDRIAEAAHRLANPLYNMTFAALALAGVLGGPFSRLGYGRRLAFVAGLAVAIRILGFAAQAASQKLVWLNVLQFAVPIIPAWWAYAVLFRAPLGRTAQPPSFRANFLQLIGASS